MHDFGLIGDEMQIDADRQVREAQIDADLKRDMLARGLSVEEIERLLGEGTRSQVAEEAGVLADAIVNMVDGEGQLDRDAVASLIEMFVKKDRFARLNDSRASAAVQRSEGMGKVGVSKGEEA